MLLLRLWNYLRGYVIILVEGYFIEKFLNICTHRQIFLWDIHRQKSSVLTMKMSIRGFKLIRPVAKKTGCRVRLIKKRGMPFVFNRYRRRKTFFAGAFLFVVLIYGMTSFIWSVEITGNKNLETVYLEDVLASHGIKPGVLKYGVNPDKAITDIMLQMKELSWLSIDVKGTKVKVEIRERRLPPPLVPKDQPCEIVAVRDGVIKQIIVTDGLEAVKVGDTVRKGQLLISGQVPIKNEEGKFRSVHAMGTVKARTWYEEVEPVLLQKTEKVRTGKVHENYSLVLFTRRIDLFHKNAGFENFEKVEIGKKLTLGENLVFPFELVIDRYYEDRLVETEINEEEAQRTAADAAYKRVMEQIPEGAEIVKSDVKFVDDDDQGIIAVATIECTEEIGLTQRIGGN